MNGAHDMGGTHGFGPVEPEPDEPVFHADWERRAFALTVAMGAVGEWNIDMSRFARENRPPADYLTKTYYELWAAGTEQLVLERGLVGADEIAEGRPLHPPRPVKRVLVAGDVAKVLARGAPTDRPATAPARYQVGDTVWAKNINPSGHTRLPRYIRGHVGVIDAVRGCQVFPDSNALGNEDPQWLYTVRFDARELWGADADPTVTVSVDAWEPYLEPSHP
jgi:nitrile hydratase beta subunit